MSKEEGNRNEPGEQLKLSLSYLFNRLKISLAVAELLEKDQLMADEGPNT